MRRGQGPVQQWVDSIPLPSKPAAATAPTSMSAYSNESTPNSSPTSPKQLIHYPKDNRQMTASAPLTVPNSPALTITGVPSRLARDRSFQSDSSHCSSVESLLELRKADPEAILLGLGFGGSVNSTQENGPLSRIPKRFLQPSKLKGIAINDFVKHQQETSESFDSTSLGYRGLTGSPYVAPSEIVQKIMDRLRENENHESDLYAAYNSSFDCNPYQEEGRLSVLSPDSRHFLEQPRSKSPDMRNKRMIIGQKSFVFGCDGDLIEVKRNNSIINLEASRTRQVLHESDDTSETSEDNLSRRSEDEENKDILLEFSPPAPHEQQQQQLLTLNGTKEEERVFERKLTMRQGTSEESCESSSTFVRRSFDDDRRSSSDGLTRYDETRSSGRRALKRQSRITEEEALSFDDSKGIMASGEEREDVAGIPEVRIEDNNDASADGSRLHTSSCSRRHEANHEESCKCQTNTSCWKRMQKIMKKNKKLEDMVTKNKREMAELRDMLTSVLSVRLEPGF